MYRNIQYTSNFKQFSIPNRNTSYNMRHVLMLLPPTQPLVPQHNCFPEFQLACSRTPMQFSDPSHAQLGPSVAAGGPNTCKRKNKRRGKTILETFSSSIFIASLCTYCFVVVMMMPGSSRMEIR